MNRKSVFSKMEKIVSDIESGNPIDPSDFISFANELGDWGLEATGLLKKLEWIMDDEWEEERCPICENWKKQGHDENCDFGKFMNE